MKTVTYRQTDKLNLQPTDLNRRESKVLGALKKAGEPLHVTHLARTCFPGQRCKAGTYGRDEGGGTDVAYRSVLNSVRRLVAAGFAKKVAKGTYAAVA
jgi:hypothetical protein